MPLVYSFFHDDVQENSRTEEENQKIGLVAINTQRGVIWANPLNRERVLEKFGRPLIEPPPPMLKPIPPPPLLKPPSFPPPPNNELDAPPPPPLDSEQSGPPPPPNSGKAPSPLSLLFKGPPPPSVGVKKAPVKAPELPTETNKSSAVPKGQMDAFVQGMVDKSDQLGFPVYSICDNNSFHTSGYLWGYYAALMVKKLRLDPGPIAVVNFDSHKDAGRAGSRVVASDRWGDILIKAMNDLGFPACYLSAFNKKLGGKEPGATVSYFNSYPAPKSAIESPNSVVPQNENNYDTKMGEIRKDFRTFWKAVNEHFGEPIKYVFFTIDRDVLNDSYTQWGNGMIRSTRQLLDLMEIVFEPLNLKRGAKENQAALIGFDVTGLPESKAWHEFSPGIYSEPKVVWSKLSQELYAVFDYAHARLHDARRTVHVPHVLFFSGSISYTTFDGSESPDWNCWDYVSFLSQRLKLLLGCTNLYYSEGWSYMLCQQTPPIYEAAWKRFTLYQPGKPLKPGTPLEVRQQLGDGTALGGFACTASVTDFTRFKKEHHKLPFDDMVNMINVFAPPQ